MKSNPVKARNDKVDDHASEFRRLAEQVADLTGAEGVRVRPYDDPQLPHFTRMSNESRHEVLERLRLYVEVCTSVKAEGGELRDSPLLLMKALKKLGLKPCKDIFDKITADTVVEIYTPNNIQIFRNLRFFEICSYTMEDIMCREWWKLFWRQDEMTRSIFNAASQIFRGEVKETLAPGIPRHLLKEKESHLLFEMEIGVDLISPLFIDGEVRAALVLESVTLFGSSIGR